MRIGVVSDIHANLAAFDVVLEALGDVDEYWCLGDVVGYGPAPNECIERLAGLKHRCILGNHDAAAIGQADIRFFNEMAAFAVEWTSSRLTPDSHSYLSALPRKFEEDDFTVVHGSPRDPTNEYLVDERSSRENFAYFTTPYCLVGHTHIPVIFAETRTYLAPDRSPIVYELGNERAIMNPGGVGQPRDGNPNARCAVIDTNQMTLRYLEVPYDIAKTQRAMQMAGLPDMLWIRLSYGR